MDHLIKFFSPGLSNLYSLSLSDNRLSYLHPEALSCCPQLVRLNLGHNLLSRLPGNMFSVTRSLAFISLEDNLLTSWPPISGKNKKNQTRFRHQREKAILFDKMIASVRKFKYLLPFFNLLFLDDEGICNEKLLYQV